MSKKTSLSSHQRNTLVRLAQGTTLMVDSENRIWVGEQRIFANTFLALRTQKLIERGAGAMMGRKVFTLSEKGREVLNGICAFGTPSLRSVRSDTARNERQGVVATEQGSGTKRGSTFEGPELPARSQRSDADLSWFAWVFLAALIGLVVVFLNT